MAQVTMYGFWRSLAAYRVRVALNMKGIAYEEPPIDLIAGEQYADRFKAINPMMAVPALDLHDGKPALAQSMAILEYLEETHPEPALLPREPRARARVREIALIVAADSHPLIVPRVRAGYLERELKLDEPTRMRWIRHWFDQGSAAIETRLAHDGLTGRFTHGDAPSIADLCIASHWVGATLFGANTSGFPTFKRVIDQCFALEAFAKAHPSKQPGAPK